MWKPPGRLAAGQGTVVVTPGYSRQASAFRRVLAPEEA
jgi:hypothetical protein